MALVTDKSAIRDGILAARRALPPAVRQAADAALRRGVAELLAATRRAGLPAVAGARRTVAGYAPTRDEPGGRELMEVFRSAGDRVLFPVLRSDLDLEWAEYTGPGGLQRARWRLIEPDGPRLGLAAVAASSIVVVPAMAVDRSGARLGRGGGSYDRALHRVPDRTPVVALLYDGELVDRLPTEPHDRRVTAVLTPTGGLCRL
jgi:5-formyltetrahydrofolate cyclo-ligase